LAIEFDEPLILGSAHRHQVSDEDMLNAYAFALAWFVDESGTRPLIMLIGPSLSGSTLLEVGVVVRPDYDAICIVHAQAARVDTLRKGGLL